MEWFIMVSCYTFLTGATLFVTYLGIWGTMEIFKNKYSSKLSKFGYVFADFLIVCIIGLMVFLWMRPHLGMHATIEDVENGDAHVVVDTVVVEDYVWNDMDTLKNE